MDTMSEPLDAVDFKSQFYNLQGTHINERRKNFNKLLKSTKIDIPDDQIDLQPRNYQENIFYVDVLIHFKKVEKLIKILKKGSGMLSNKILKQQWFIQEAFKNMSEEDIVNNFLTSLSHSLKMKVLKKLSLTLNEERMDKMFDLLLERYGIFVAKQILFGCTPGKIAHVLRNHEIILLPELLKRIVQKDFKLLKIYIEEYKKNTNRDFENYQFLSYLIWKHPKLYFELGLDSTNGIKLGRYTTRAVIKTNKEGVLKDIKNCSFNKGALIREVKEFDKEYLSLFFPNDIKDIVNHASDLATLVSKYPIKKRWEVISQAFKKSYNKEVVENLDIFEENLATFFPENIQQKWAAIKYLDSNNVKYIQYYDPKKAFKLIKDKINVTSDISTRGLFLNELIIVCYKHKDYSTYEEVLKYICSRHRNDDKNERSSLIDHIDKNIDYDLITESHWKYINEIIDIQRVKDGTVSRTVKSKYFVFAYKKKLPLDTPATQHAKDCIISSESLRLWLKEVEVESAVLKCILKILPSIEHSKVRDVIGTLLHSIVDFNKEIIKDNSLSRKFRMVWVDLAECPVILDIIQEVVKKQEPYEGDDYCVVSQLMLYNYLYSEVPLKGIDEDALLNIVKVMSRQVFHNFMVIDCILEIIKKSNRNCFEEKLLDCFFTDIIKCHTTLWNFKMDGLQHFLTREPQIIAKYFNIILPLDPEADNNLPLLYDYNTIKKYSHLGLDEKVITYFKELVSVDSMCQRKNKLLNALSSVMDTTEFLEVVKGYIPGAKKLDLDKEEQKDIYQVQCNITKDFKNLDKASYHTLAPVLMNFCQGDYMESTLPVLYKVMYGINEEKVMSYVNVLGGSAMSSRKHAVVLSFEVLPITDAMAVYALVSNKETNISAKKYLFKSILKYFIRNPLRSLLDIVAFNMDFIDKNDSKLITILVKSVSKVPNEYKPLFIEKVWGFLDSLEHQDVDVIKERTKILKTINENEIILILKINKNFCEELIKKYFLSSDDALLKYSYEIYRFIVRFLLAYLDEPHFEFVFNIIRLYKEIHWESNNIDSLSYIFSFFMHAYKKFDDNNLKFLKLFTKFWQQTFSHLESCSHYIFLKLMILYKQNTNIEAYCKEVDKFFQELMVKYGPYIGELIFKSLETFYSNISTKDNIDFDLGNFAFYLLQSNLSELNCFVAFKIIKDFTSSDQEKIYLKVVDAIKSGTHLRVYSNILLKGNLI